MAANDERSIRLLNLVTALQSTSRPLTIDEIRSRVPGYTAEEFQSFRRTFERDKDDLRSLGIVIEVDDAVGGEPGASGYRIRRDRHELADPGLSQRELAALVAASQLVRLSGADLGDPTDGMRKLGGFGSAPSTLGTDVVVVDVPEHLALVLDAVLECRVLQVDYRGRRRSVAGDGIRFQRGHWYLLGRELPDGEDRTYRVDRMESVAAGPPGEYERRSEERRVAMRPWEYGDGDPTVVTVSLDDVAVRSLLADDHELEVEEQDGARRVRLDVVDELRLFRFLASFLDRVELVDPPDVRTRYVAWLEAIAAGVPEPATGGA